MRATTRAMPNVSRATRAAMMLELSPLETAAKASARSTPGLDEHLAVEALADDLAPGKSADEPAERLRVLVDHGHLVAEPIEARGERGPDPAAAHDDDVHGGTLSQAAPVIGRR